MNDIRNLETDSVPLETSLRFSALGELISMLLATTGMIGALAWLLFLGEVPVGLVMMASGIWLFLRSASIGSHSLLTPLITLLLLGGVIALKRTGLADCPVWLSSGPAGTNVFLTMLGFQLFIDLIDQGRRISFGSYFASLRNWNWKRISVWAVFLGLATYLVLIPACLQIWETISPQKLVNQTLDDLTFLEQMRIRVTSLVIAALFFALGSSIGSYLNVVVYRLPLGKSLVNQPSSCPVCNHQIESRDNIPIIGWLQLNGRCRHCQTPISARYPIVELITGSLFLLLYYAELLTGGANLPVRTPNNYAGVVWIIFYTKWDLIAIYLFHCFLLTTLWCWFLITRDGHIVPLATAIRMLLLMFVATLLWPGFLQIPVWPDQLSHWPLSYTQAVLASVIGMFTGGISGYFLRWKLHQSGLRIPASVMAAFSMIGIAFGWQGVLLLTTLVHVLLPIGHLMKMDLSKACSTTLMGGLFLVSLLYLLCWRILANIFPEWFAGPVMTPQSLFLWIAGLMVICFLPMKYEQK